LEVSAARPDAFRPDLARSLHNLSNRLADLGRPQDALDAGEEAVTIRRELAARWPDAYRHELEQSLRVVAWLQHGESNASSTHPRGSPGRDNGPLSRAGEVLSFMSGTRD
jgi:Tetratricopeptide repeat